MRYLNGFLCLVMLLFAGVQYNDPDVALWATIYGIPAIWAGLAAFRPSVFQQIWAVIGLALSVAAAAVGTVYYWPRQEGFWRQEVWWTTETAREGMGMMIAAAVLVVVAVTGLRARQRRPSEM